LSSFIARQNTPVSPFLRADVTRNPKTGEAVQMPAKVALHFKPGKDMKDRVNAARNLYVIVE